MTPLKQTILDDGRGNCFQTAVASILDLPLEQVPHFLEQGKGSVTEPFKAWLNARGLDCIHLCFGSWDALKRVYFDNWHCLVILSGLSPRRRPDGSTKQHAVIARCAGYGFEFVHDPHPDDTFLDTTMPEGHTISPYWVWFIHPSPAPATVTVVRPGEWVPVAGA